MTKDMKNYEEQFGSAPLLPLILKMALPSVAAQLINILYSIVDRIYIGHIPETGTAALAGVGVCSTLIVLCSAFAMLGAGGAAPIASIALGKGNRDRAEKILNNGFTMLLIFSGILILVFGAFLRPILLLIGASETSIGFAVTYFTIYLIGTPAVQVTLGLNTFINVQGRPMTAMLSVMIGAVLNIVLDPVLIFGCGMGVAGAAAATVISQYASAAWILRFLTSRQASLRIVPGRKADGTCPMKPDPEILKPMFAMGISPFIMYSTESLIGFVLNGSLVRYGDIYVSALTIMQSALQFVSVPLQGFSQGCVPVLSYNFGHRNPERVKRGFRILMAVQFSTGFVLYVLMILFPRFVARIFTQDPLLIETVGHTMPVFLAGMTIFGMQRACQNTFLALGQARISIFIALLRKIILLIPLALLLPVFFGVMGVFAAEAAADAAAASICAVLFFVRFPGILKQGS